MTDTTTVALSAAERDALRVAAPILSRLSEGPVPLSPPRAAGRRIAWGAAVSPLFRDRVSWIAEDLDIGNDSLDGASKLMACMHWESDGSFSPSKKNLAGSGATGLIQFMPKTAIGLGTTTAALALMSAEDQLNYVWKYFAPFDGGLRTLADVYMAILWPAAIGLLDSSALWTRSGRPTTYRQNSGLDANTDGTITKGEAAAKVAARLRDGLLPINIG